LAQRTSEIDLRPLFSSAETEPLLWGFRLATLEGVEALGDGVDMSLVL